MWCSSPWSQRSPAPSADRAGPARGPVTALLTAHPAATDALAALLGCDDPWSTGTPAGRPAHDLLRRHPESAAALLAAIGSG